MHIRAERGSGWPRTREKFSGGTCDTVSVGAIEANEVIRYLLGKNDENKVDKACSERYIIID